MNTSKTISKELAEKAIEKMQQAVEYYDRLERLAEEYQKQLQETSYNERNAAPCDYCQPSNEIIEMDADLGEIGKMAAGIGLYISEMKDKSVKAELSVYLEHTNNEDHSDTLGERYIDINYCPFCGRRLK